MSKQILILVAGYQVCRIYNAKVDGWVGMLEMSTKFDFKSTVDTLVWQTFVEAGPVWEVETSKTLPHWTHWASLNKIYGFASHSQMSIPFIVYLLLESMSSWFRKDQPRLLLSLFSGLKHLIREIMVLGSFGTRRTVVYHLHAYLFVIPGLKNWWGELECSLASQLCSSTRSSVTPWDTYFILLQIICVLKGLWILH